MFLRASFKGPVLKARLFFIAVPDESAPRQLPFSGLSSRGGFQTICEVYMTYFGWTKSVRTTK